jgi:hypothetical protein
MRRLRSSSIKSRGVAFLALLVCLFGLPAFGQPWDGNGVEGDPYQIWDACDMQAIGADANYWDAHFKLMADIDLSGFTGSQFNVIGYYHTDLDSHSFTGGFDGDGHIISNFTHVGSSVNCLGLFGYVETGAQIFDVGLVDCDVDEGSNATGSLIGLLKGGTVSNCWSYYGTVSGGFRSGGLIGQVSSGTVNSCFTEGGQISAEYNYSGGLAGENKGDISNCYAMCSVGDSEGIVGGLVGYNNGGNITFSYSTGPITGDWGLGGLVGDNTGSVNSSFWDVESSGLSYSSGGSGKTTEQMQTSETFTDSGWDFTTPIWTICESLDYPRLWWENTQCIKYGGGTGKANNPYLIYTAEQMNEIGTNRSDWDAHFKLMADINLAEYTGTQYNIIGNGTQSFTGYFDGNNHTISNFSYNETGTNYIGLFGRTGNTPADVGQIRNLTLDIVDVNGGTGRFVGSLVGHARGSVINCRVNGGLVQGQEDVGGLIGSFAYCVVANCSAACDVEGGEDVGGLTGTGGDQSAMIQCFATGQINGDDYVGGLMGRNSGEIIRCSATGDVIGTAGGYNAGGLAGMSGPGSVIQDSFSRGDVEGEFFVGGFLGMNWQADVTHCYSVGFVSGATLVGGFIGNNNLPGSNTNCFWDNQSSGQDFGIGAGSSDGIYGRSTAEMKMESTFTDAGWDFTTPIWSIEEGIDYPMLVFQEYVHDYGGGTGIEDDPFLIYTDEHMQEIGSKRHHWDRHFRLMNDIDLSQYDGQDGRARFNKIGYYNGSTDYLAFTGVFDGNNRTIYNFTYNTTTESMVGLFGYSAEEGVVIKNLGLINPNVSAAEGYQQIGALAGSFRDGTLENCYVQDANVNGDFMVGALVGRLREGTILHCQASGSVVGNVEVGGLAGENDKGEIYYCEADVSVSASSYESGGLLGELNCGLAYGCGAHGDVNGADITGGLIGANPLVFSGTTCTGDIIDCYATGNVSSGGSAGGLVSFSAGPLIRCSASGSVKGGLYVGGLAGNAGDITECYAMGDASGEDAVGGLAGTSSYVMSDSFALGDVNGRYDIGGLSGINYGTIQNCYSTGFVSGLGGVGGLVGYNDADGNIVDCFWDTQTSGQTVMCSSSSSGYGCDDSCGKTTTEMKMRTTFTSAGWDFVGEVINGPNDIWTICEGVDYPKLTWQFIIGDFDGDDDIDFADFAIFAAYWLEADSSFYCGGGGTDLTNDGQVGLDDLRQFTENWLAGM